MKVLLIDARQGGDWSLDLLFSGLVKNLGPKNVIDYPIHMKHRTGPIVPSGDPAKDWGRERQSLGFTERYNELHNFSDREIQEMVRRNEFDFVFVDERVESFELYLSLRANFSSIPVVVVAGHDRFWGSSPTDVARLYGKNFLFMFCDNWRREYDSIPRMGLYSWSHNFDHLWEREQRSNFLSEKIYDICFLGYNSHGNRSEIVDHVLSKWGHLNNCILLERQPDKMSRFLIKREYFQKMAQSKICLNIRGAAENGKALRFWEIPYVGSLMVSQGPIPEMLHPPTPDLHFSSFEDLKKLDFEIEKYLESPDRREMVAKAGHEFFMRYHSSEFRVSEMLQLIQGRLRDGQTRTL